MEKEIGTDPEDIDSDGDAIDDLMEVGDIVNALDRDGDGIIDALENNYLDSDSDGIHDIEDPATSWQVAYLRFVPFAIVNDRPESTTFEVRLSGGEDLQEVRVFFPATLRLFRRGESRFQAATDPYTPALAWRRRLLPLPTS